jgi:two-component system, sporulation sensor kinase B
MLLTKVMLLHLLAILSPTLFYSFYFERKQSVKSSYLFGVLYGLAAFLCVFFPHEAYGMNWDLRFVPLVLSLLYEGWIAGLIVFAFIIAGNVASGGDVFPYNLLSGALAFVAPYLVHNVYFAFQRRTRIVIASLVGTWPALVLLFFLIMSMSKITLTEEASAGITWNILIAAIFHFIAIAIGAKLHESVIEKQQMNKEIEQAVKQKTLSVLAASVAHEVRNPLTVVKGFLQLMKENYNANNHRYLPLVLSELERAESIINDYLNFAKPKLGQLETFELSEFLDNTVLLIEPLAMKENVRLKRWFQGQVLISTDKNHLQQALVNIIKNAIEATPPEGIVSIEMSPERDHVVIVIGDTGKGMSADELSRIGSLFYTTKDKGTGLGTTVSLRVIEALNGKVYYQSELGKGTEVTITLPLMNEELPGKSEQSIGFVNMGEH